MSGKDLVKIAGFAMALWHAFSLAKDAERYMANVTLLFEQPTGRNLVRTLLAEGALIGDIRAF